MNLLFILIRRISCFIFGHEKKCYLPPATKQDEINFYQMRNGLNLSYSVFWRKIGKGWCGYCARHISEPVRFRK